MIQAPICSIGVKKSKVNHTMQIWLWMELHHNANRWWNYAPSIVVPYEYQAWETFVSVYSYPFKNTNSDKKNKQLMVFVCVKMPVLIKICENAYSPARSLLTNSFIWKLTPWPTDSLSYPLPRARSFVYILADSLTSSLFDPFTHFFTH